MDATPLFFADSTVDRRNEIRADDKALQDMQHAANARYLLVSRGRVKAVHGTPLRIAWLRRAELDAQGVDCTRIAFLGILEQQPRFAVIPNEAPLTANDRSYSIKDQDDLVSLRRAAATMLPAEAQLAGHAAHLSNWINRNRYCGSCMAPMSVREGGHKLICTNSQCAREEFPRTDPVVMALVTYGDRCLLARQKNFPPKFFAPLAGFVEPGEALEAAVQREVREEVRLDVHTTRYIASQPWPFPASLMVGYLAEAADDSFVINQQELEDGRWFAREEIATLCAPSPAADAPVWLPPKGIIGRSLIDAWMETFSAT